MDVERIELLFKKVESAGKVITEYKRQLAVEHSKIEELKKQISFLQKDNQTLVDENKKLKELSSSADKMHKKLEDKIISLLDTLPDFEAIKEESPTSSVPVASKENVSLPKEKAVKEDAEKSSSIFDTVAEFSGTQEETFVSSPEENPFSMEEDEEFEIGNMDSHNDAKLPYYETEEGNIDYKNMFAIDNILGNEEGKKSGSDLPKGIL